MKLSEMTLAEFNQRFPGVRLSVQEVINISKLIGDEKTIRILDAPEETCEGVDP